MRDDIETELHKQMIHIKHTDDNYEIFDSLRYICEKITQNYYQFKGKKAKKQFDTHKKIIELLDICYTNKPHVYEEIKMQLVHIQMK
jgi:hypothetical protein